MKHISEILTLFAAATVLLSTGCTKDVYDRIGSEEGLPMVIQPEVVTADGALKSDDGGATKATLISDAAGLRTQGFGLSIYNEVGTAYKENVKMVHNGTAWTHPFDATDWKWPAGQAYTFYAWSPAALNVGTVTSTGVPAFAYSGITDQTDIMLGCYSGMGDNGVAPVTFSHALASVQFKTGKITGMSVSNIKSIELRGIVTSGTCTPAMSGTTTSFAWSDFGSETTSITQTGLDVASGTSGIRIGDPFLILPQSGELNVKLTFNNDQSINAAIPSPILNAGKTTAYSINYDGLTVSFTVSIEDWGEGQSDEVGLTEDRKLWIDLGMVSANGHPLLISSRDVKSISASNVVTFVENETDLGEPFTARNYYSAPLLDENGSSCTLMTSASLLSILSNNNNTLAFDDATDCWMLESKISGSYIYLNPGTYGCADLGSTATTGGIGLVLGSTDADVPFCTRDASKEATTILRLLREDTSVTHDFTDVRATSNLKSETINYSEISGKVMSDDGKFNGSNNSTLYFGIELSCESGYKLYSFEKVPTGIVDIIPGNVTGGTLSVKDGIEYALVSSSSATPSTTNPINAQVKFYCNSELKHTYSYTRTCFVKGTPITLADGSRKRIEELTYDDELLVWNFDEGCLDSAKPLFLSKDGSVSDGYYKVVFSDGTELRLCGPDGHKLFNYTDKIFEYAAKIAPGKQVYTEKGLATLVSCEYVEEEVEYYNLFTSYHINCFAGGVLASCPMNEIYPIDKDMKFVKEGRTIRPWREFRKAFKEVGMGKEWYREARIGEQPYSIEFMKQTALEIKATRKEKPEPGFFEKVWNWIKNLFKK